MIQWRNIDKNVFSKCSTTIFDLSGAGSKEIFLFNAKKDIKINSITLFYDEASSADDGTAINFGNVASATTYWTTTSEVSKAAGYIKTIEGVTLTKDIIAKGTPFIITNVGSKVWTWTIVVSVNYTVL